MTSKDVITYSGVKFLFFKKSLLYLIGLQKNQNLALTKSEKNSNQWSIPECPSGESILYCVFCTVNSENKGRVRRTFFVIYILWFLLLVLLVVKYNH